eukprot:14166324-Alexandrium_andersonii.AAC.1
MHSRRQGAAKHRRICGPAGRACGQRRKVLSCAGGAAARSGRRSRRRNVGSLLAGACRKRATPRSLRPA